MLHLANDEWIRLKETWGTERVDEIQIMLMLGEGQSRTLIARSIYYAGLVGITLCWHKLDDMREPRPYGEGEKRTFIGELRDYLYEQLKRYWISGNGLLHIQTLASSIKKMIKTGITTHTAQTSGRGLVGTARNYTK